MRETVLARNDLAGGQERLNWSRLLAGGERVRRDEKQSADGEKLCHFASIRPRPAASRRDWQFQFWGAFSRSVPGGVNSCAYPGRVFGIGNRRKEAFSAVGGSPGRGTVRWPY